MSIKRRDFLKAAAASAAAMAMEKWMSDTAQAGETQGSSNPAILARRPYGRSQIPLSIIGFGGIVVMNAQQEHANRVVAEAFERGVNYYDVAPSYGNSEEKLGPALEPYRKRSFLACKTTQRTADAAKAEMKQSMQRLRTDWFDLYQLHAITDVKKDVDAAFAKGGVMDVLIAAKKAGQIRHIGCSAHSVDAALTALDRYDFDSILFPVNFATFYKGDFGPQIIEKAKSKGASCLALKMLARQQWPANDPMRKQFPKAWYQPITDRHEAELAAKFTLSQPITAAIPPGEESLFRLALDLAMQFRPISDRETQELQALAQKLNPLFHA